MSDNIFQSYEPTVAFSRDLLKYRRKLITSDNVTHTNFLLETGSYEVVMLWIATET